VKASLVTFGFPKVNLFMPAYALFFANIMDIYTTIQSLAVGNSESNPIIASLMGAYGLTGFALCKTGIILAVISLVFLAIWLAEKSRCKPEDIYFARRFSHFGLWLAAACYLPVIANNLITFYIKVYGIPI
jgi:hypothetical protein